MYSWFKKKKKTLVKHHDSLWDSGVCQVSFSRQTQKCVCFQLVYSTKLEHNYFLQVCYMKQQDDYISSSSCLYRFLTTKEKFHGFIDSEWQGSKGEKASDNDTAEETKETSEEPECKKLKLDPEKNPKAGRPDGKRLRGQNKSRPHTKPTAYDEKRLCLSVIQVCSFNSPSTCSTF